MKTYSTATCEIDGQLVELFDVKVVDRDFKPEASRLAPGTRSGTMEVSFTASIPVTPDVERFLAGLNEQARRHRERFAADLGVTLKVWDAAIESVTKALVAGRYWDAAAEDCALVMRAGIFTINDDAANLTMRGRIGGAPNPDEDLIGFLAWAAEHEMGLLQRLLVAVGGA